MASPRELMDTPRTESAYSEFPIWTSRMGNMLHRGSDCAHFFVVLRSPERHGESRSLTAAGPCQASMIVSVRPGSSRHGRDGHRTATHWFWRRTGYRVSHARSRTLDYSVGEERICANRINLRKIGRSTRRADL